MVTEMIEFGDLLLDSTRNGISKPKSIRGNGIPMINMGELFKYDRIPALEDLELIPMTDSEKERFILKKGDLVFARRSLTLEGAGKCSIYLADKEATFESSIIQARIDENKANPQFYYYYFNSNIGTALIRSIAEQVAVAGIRGSDLKKLKVHTFDRSFQDKTVQIMSSIDEKIEINKQIIEKLEIISRAIFKHWFIDFEFLNEQGQPYKSRGGKMVESELGMIPEGWNISTLNDFAEIGSGKRPKVKVDVQDQINRFPIIGASKVMGYTNDFLLNEEVLVMGRVGTHGIIQSFKTEIWPSDNTLTLRSKYQCFLEKILEQVDFKSLNRGSTQPLITQTDVKKIKTVFNEKVVLEFEKTVRPFKEAIYNFNSENEKFTKLRDTLLPKLLSGEIEVPVLEPEQV